MFVISDKPLTAKDVVTHVLSEKTLQNRGVLQYSTIAQGSHSRHDV